MKRSKNQKNQAKKKIPNEKSTWFKKEYRKSKLDMTDKLFPVGVSGNLEMKKFNIENNSIINDNDDKLNFESKIIDLRKGKSFDGEISEIRNILPEKIDNNGKKELDQIAKKDDNPDIKEYYIQTLKNMRVKANIKIETPFKAYFNWTKFFGYGKDTKSTNYKLKKNANVAQSMWL